MKKRFSQNDVVDVVPRRPKKPASRPAKPVKGRAAKARRQKISSAKPSTAVAAAVRDAVTGQFQKGFSGNPNGSKIIVPEEVRELARQYSPEAVLRLVDWLRCDDPQASITAAKILLDRGLGKAIQPLIGTGVNGSLINLTINNGGTIASADAADIYRELCADPSLDISALKFEEPMRPVIEQQPVIEHPAVLDPLAPASDTTKLWERLGK